MQWIKTNYFKGIEIENSSTKLQENIKILEKILQRYIRKFSLKKNYSMKTVAY